MGIVKYNNTNLTVEGVPDGSMIITPEQHTAYTQTQNAYTLLKSKMPIGVSENDLALLVEKGQRFDSLNTEFSTTKTKLTETETKLAGFKNIPEGFSVEKWNQLTAKEKAEVRSGQITQLTKAVEDKLKKDYPDKTPPTIDQRFLPADKVATFDPTAADAQDKWAAILGEGFTAQNEFLNRIVSNGVTPPVIGGGSIPAPVNNNDAPVSVPKLL